MTYNFDQCPDRRGSESVKWDLYPGTLPLWVADMDFPIAPEIQQALQQRLKARNQLTILLGFLLMFAIAFISILVQQWQLRANLEELRRKNSEALASRRAYQKAMDAKESENDFKIKILQNRTTNVLTDYEDFLRSE